MEKQEKKLICHKCNEELVLQRTDFTYLGHAFFTDLPRCPKCGQVFISEDLVRGRISDVETQLEDK